MTNKEKSHYINEQLEGLREFIKVREVLLRNVVVWGKGFELSQCAALRHPRSGDLGGFEGCSHVRYRGRLFEVKTERGKSGHWHSVMRPMALPPVGLDVKRAHPVTASNAADLRKWMIKLVERFDQLEYLEDEE